MKITHICLSGPVTDGWNYQDNLLPKYHKRLGYDVSLITSKWIWGTAGKTIKTEDTTYVNDDGVKMIRLDIRDDKPLVYKFRRFVGLYETLEDEEPGILFIHGVAFLDIDTIVKYLKKHNRVRTYADNHSDFSNSATNWISKNILHKVVWRHYAQKLVPYTTKFYGVLPARVDFLTDVYKLPKDKCELLVMGADDDKIAEVKREHSGRAIREKYGIDAGEFLIVTGGKIDKAKKQTLFLMEAVAQIKNVKLLVFGSVDEDLRLKFDSLCSTENIMYAGWINAQDSYAYFDAADLVVFPGRHSVFWEQVAGQGIPMVCKYWEGTTHIDLGGNVKFLQENNSDENAVEEIKTILNGIVDRGSEYSNMLQIARENSYVFSYLNIARMSIDDMHNQAET